MKRQFFSRVMSSMPKPKNVPTEVKASEPIHVSDRGERASMLAFFTAFGVGSLGFTGFFVSIAATIFWDDADKAAITFAKATPASMILGSAFVGTAYRYPGKTAAVVGAVAGTGAAIAYVQSHSSSESAARTSRVKPN